MKREKEVISGAISLEWTGILPDGSDKIKPMNCCPTRAEIEKEYEEIIMKFRSEKIGMVLVITEKGEYGIGERQNIAVEDMDKKHPGTRDKTAYFFYT